MQQGGVKRASLQQLKSWTIIFFEQHENQILIAFMMNPSTALEAN